MRSSRMRLERSPHRPLRHPYTIQKRLCPLLPEFVEASLLKIIWSHDDSEFDTRVESQKPRLCKGGNLLGIGHFDNHDRATLTVLFCEIDGFRFYFVDNATKLLTGSAISNVSIKRV